MIAPFRLLLCRVAPSATTCCNSGKRKEPELIPAEQCKRFKEAAKKAGVTNDEEECERTFNSVANARQTAPARKSR